jgi:hypothetical protein
VGWVLHSKSLGTRGVNKQNEGGWVHDYHNRTMSHAIHEEMFLREAQESWHEDEFGDPRP